MLRESGLSLRPYLLVIILVSALPAPAPLAAKDATAAASSAGKGLKARRSTSTHEETGPTSKGPTEDKGKAATGASHPEGKNAGVAPVDPHPTLGRSIKRRDAIDAASHRKETGAPQKGEHDTNPKAVGDASKDDTETKTTKGATDHGVGEGVAPIDTRIPEQSSHSSRPPDKLGQVKALIRPSTKPALDGEIVRNAIGTQVTPPPARQGPPSVSTSAVSAPASSSENTNGRLGVGNPKAQQSTELTTTVTAINRAAINGTGLGRLGSGPAIVRGPAKSVGQINGATIRAKP